MYDTGSTTFMLICTMLVFLMTPGLAFFYGGLSRRKNVINTMLMCFGAIGLVGVLWIVAGCSLAYGGHAGRGLCRAMGSALTGLFCVPELSWTGKGGLFYTGDASLLVSQVLGIVVTVVIVLFLDVVIAAVVKASSTAACAWTRPTRRWAWTRASTAKAHIHRLAAWINKGSDLA